MWWCDFCHTSHSSSSCYHPGRFEVRELEEQLRKLREEHARLGVWLDRMEAASRECLALLEAEPFEGRKKCFDTLVEGFDRSPLPKPPEVGS